MPCPVLHRRRSAISTTALSEKWLVPPPPSSAHALSSSSVSDSGGAVLPTVPRLTKASSSSFFPAPKSQSTFPSNPASLVAFLNKHFGDAFFESIGRTLYRSEDGTVLIVTAFHNVFKEVTVKCCINYDNRLRR